MSEIKKVLITGSNGMLGKDMVKIFKRNGKYDIHGLNRTTDTDLLDDKSIVCDITDEKELTKILERVEPEIIIHCAAMVDVDGCEKNNEYADMLNIESTKQLAAYNPEKTKFVYISTDSVFDGQRSEYSEESGKNPLNYYAITKCKAEDAVKNLNPNNMIIRTNIYGFHKLKGESLVEWAIDEFMREQKIFGFKDVYFNPVYTKQLARVVYELLEINYSGIIHVGAHELLSKYDFLKKLAVQFNIDMQLVASISVDDITFDAKRPKNTSLSTCKLNSLLNYKLNIDDGLNELYKDYNERSL